MRDSGQDGSPPGLRFDPCFCIVTCAFRWLSVPYAFVQFGQLYAPMDARTKGDRRISQYVFAPRDSTTLKNLASEG